MNPVFYKNGVPAVAANVGDAITFDVPGYPRIWLFQMQDARTQYDGIVSVPIAPYTLQDRDAGFFRSWAYEVTADNKRGQLIGSTYLQVGAAGAAAGGGTTAAPGGTTVSTAACPQGICGPSQPIAPIYTGGPGVGGTPSVSITGGGGVIGPAVPLPQSGGGAPNPFASNLPGLGQPPAPGSPASQAAANLARDAGAGSTGVGFNLKDFITGPFGLVAAALVIGFLLLSKKGG